MSEGLARYHFNVLTPSGVVQDIEGSELSSLEEARAEAIKDARFLMSGAILRPDPTPGLLTPSITERNSCVSGTSETRILSWDIRSHRAKRCGISYRAFAKAE
jgi:hypothetical protein